MNKNNSNVITNDTTYIKPIVIDYNKVCLFHYLMERTFMEDGKTVYWNGDRAFVANESMHEESILKDHIYNTDIKMINFFEEWSVMFADSTGLTFLKDYIITRTADDYFFVNATHYFRIRKVNYEKAVNKLENNYNFVEITENVKNDKLGKRYKDYSIYRGVVQNEDKVYAGFTAIVDGYSDNAYELSYFSKGDMLEICKSAFAFINGFCDSFF